MEREEFSQLKNFSLKEKDCYGRIITAKLKDVQVELMVKADYMVSLAKKYFHPKAYFIVGDINLGKHSDDSYHYQGMAIDGTFRTLTLMQMFYCAQLAGFKGVGAYGGDVWKTPGIHGDIREQEHQSVWYAWEDQVWDAKLGKYVPKRVYNYDRGDVFDYLYTPC